MELPDELIAEQLLRLPPKDLSSYCQSHRQVARVCQSDWFWKLKVDRDFYGVSQYKPVGISYRQEYQDLFRTKNPNAAAQLGRLDILIALDHQGLHPDQWGANWAADHGHVNVLEWM